MKPRRVLVHPPGGQGAQDAIDQQHHRRHADQPPVSRPSRRESVERPVSRPRHGVEPGAQGPLAGPDLRRMIIAAIAGVRVREDEQRDEGGGGEVSAN